MALKRFSPQWWQNREVSSAWCERFCQPIFNEDPSLRDDPKVHETVGAIFYNTPHGDIIPAGVTALKGDEFIFQYHPYYLAQPDLPPISDTLPKREERFTSRNEMLPFFDNLPAEGWLGKAQGAALGDESCLRRLDTHSHHMDQEPLQDRYHRFMMFGRDYPGAVWGTYIRIDPQMAEEHYQETIRAALRSRSSISGMQPKLLGVKENGEVRPAHFWETSTHIVKLPPAVHMPRLMEYEYMSIVATRALLPDDPPVEAYLTDLQLPGGAKKEVLAIKRFDRNAEGGKVHFEEFNQLLGKQNYQRYKGAYADIAGVIREKIGHEGVKKFYARLMCQFLLGNTDNHLKNFALLHNYKDGSWSMAPDYDLAPTVNYRKSTLALFATPYRGQRIGGGTSESEELYTNLSPKILVAMGRDFGLSLDEIQEIVNRLKANIPAAKEAVMADPSERLDTMAPLDESSSKWHTKHGVAPKAANHQTCREDFCDRIDGRAQQLFGTLDKYIKLQKEKDGRGGRGR